MIKRNQHDPRYIIKKNRPVYVYKNLHKDCWSIKQHGLVKAHIPQGESIGLWDCYFHVDMKGRKRYLRVTVTPDTTTNGAVLVSAVSALDKEIKNASNADNADSVSVS